MDVTLSKKNLFMFMIGLLFISLLAGCSKGEKNATVLDDTPGEQQENNKGDKLKSPEPATITFYINTSEESFQHNIVEPVQKKYPYITPKFADVHNNPLADIIATGQVPDIVSQSTSVVGEMQTLGLQYDLTSLFKNNNFDIGRFEPSLINGIKSFGKNGEIYALPVGRGPAALAYNKDIFDKFGVSYPKDGMTWEETIELGKRVTRQEDGRQYYGLDPDIMMRPSTQLSASYFDENGKVNITSPPWPRLARLYKDILGIPGNARKGNVHDFYKNRDIAMMTTGISPFLQAASTINEVMNWDIASWPTFKEAPGIGPSASSQMYAITSTSKQKDAAFKAISHLLSDEVQLEATRLGTTVTPLKGKQFLEQFADDNPDLRDKHTEAIFMNEPAVDRYTKYDRIAQQITNKAFGTDLEKNDTDINTFLRDLEAEIQTAVDKAK
jgi:multiple sugar transport system substrate-binding protein